MKRFILFLCFSLALATPVVAEIPTIHCPTEPPRLRRFQLQERWRIDAEDPESPLLGYFDQSQVLAHDGRVYLLDQQLCHILIYSDDGEFLGTIMREGEGPGEVRNPGVMFMCSDGRIAVQHGYPTKLEFIELDGTPRGRWRLHAHSWANRIQETRLGYFGIYTESKESDEPGESTSVFHAALHDNEGRRTDEFYSESRKRRPWQDGATDEAEEHQPWYTAVAVADGQVVLAAERDEYKLEWRNLGGEVTRVVTRDFTAHRRTQAELDKLKYTNYSIMNGEFKFADRKLCERDPMIRTIEPLPDGSLRVRTSLFENDLPPGMVCRYEVHESTGELRERVEIHDPTGDYDVNYDVIVLLDDDRAMVLRNVRPAFRAATDARRHPEILEKLPPIPDDREDVAFTPIMCDLIPFNESQNPESGKKNRKSNGLKLSTFEWDYKPWMESFSAGFHEVWLAPYAYRIGVISGDVELKITVEKDGVFSEIRVTDSNGHESLVPASVEPMEKISGKFPLPEDFPEEKLVITMRLHYPEFRKK